MKHSWTVTLIYTFFFLSKFKKHNNFQTDFFKKLFSKFALNCKLPRILQVTLRKFQNEELIFPSSCLQEKLSLALSRTCQRPFESIKQRISHVKIFSPHINFRISIILAKNWLQKNDGLERCHCCNGNTSPLLDLTILYHSLFSIIPIRHLSRRRDNWMIKLSLKENKIRS